MNQNVSLQEFHAIRLCLLFFKHEMTNPSPCIAYSCISITAYNAWKFLLTLNDANQKQFGLTTLNGQESEKECDCCTWKFWISYHGYQLDSNGSTKSYQQCVIFCLLYCSVHPNRMDRMPPLIWIRPRAQFSWNSCGLQYHFYFQCLLTF